MDILLCAATPFEIEPTMNLIKQRGLGQEVGIVITGVGLVAAAHAITRGILIHRPSFVLQAGIAGSFDPSLLPGMSVAVLAETIGDLGVEEDGRFQTLFDLGLDHPDEHPWTAGALRNSDETLLRSFGLPLVDAVSVQEITTHPQRIERLKKNSAAGIETMEGAALHYAAIMEGTKFAQIRAISNFVGERDKKKWKLKGSIESLNVELQNILIKTLNS